MTLKTRIFTHLSRVSLVRFTFCWWRHNRLAMTSQWPDNCDANTWQVISNLLDIDFIHGDIHTRSCKNLSILSIRKTFGLSKFMYSNFHIAWHCKQIIKLNLSCVAAITCKLGAAIWYSLSVCWPRTTWCAYLCIDNSGVRRIPYPQRRMIYVFGILSQGSIHNLASNTVSSLNATLSISWTTLLSPAYSGKYLFSSFSVSANHYEKCILYNILRPR